MNRLLLMVALVAVGCELPSSEIAETSTPAPAATTAPAATPAPTPVASAETPTFVTPDVPVVDVSQAEWDAIQWHTEKGDANPGAVQVMTLSSELFEGGAKVRFSYDSYPWGDGGLVHYFFWNGSTWEGGKFDHIKPGGQTIKLTENIAHGYNGLRIPPSGSQVAFAFTDYNGNQRSNLSKTTWP